MSEAREVLDLLKNYVPPAPLTQEERTEVRKAYSNAFGKLLVEGRDNIYYAHFLSEFRFRVSDDPTMTAGVGFKGRTVMLYLGKPFLKYTLAERVAILKHEVLHVLFRHNLRKQDRNHDLFNVACDIAINQFIPDIPKDACNLLTGVKQGEEPLKPLQTAEYYYNELINRGATIRHTFDFHGDWLDSLTPEERAEFEKIIQGIGERAKTRSRGNISSELEEMLQLNNVGRPLSWLTILRRGVGKKSKRRVETIKKRNKRYPNRIEMRGFKRQTSCDLLVVLDVSGSVEDFEIVDAVSAIRQTCRQSGAMATILQVDTEIKKPVVLGANETKFMRKGNGGTNLYPAIEFIKREKMNPDMILVVTDGAIESSWEEPPRTKVMFLLFEKGQQLNLDLSNFPIKPSVHYLK